MKQRSKYCAGCRNDFYNGNNPLGVKLCWHLADAKVVSRVPVPIWQRPPWTMPAERTLSCHTRDGYAMVEPEHVKNTNASVADFRARGGVFSEEA